MGQVGGVDEQKADERADDGGGKHQQAEDDLADQTLSGEMDVREFLVEVLHYACWESDSHTVAPSLIIRSSYFRAWLGKYLRRGFTRMG